MNVKNIEEIRKEEHLEDEILLDPDTDESAGRSRISLGDIALVFAGGCLGGLLRAGLFELLSTAVALFAVNILGAFLLGFTLESLIRGSKAASQQKALRLFLGTGCMGALTTYSSFISFICTLIQGGQLPIALGVTLAMLAIGFIAAISGIQIARMRSERSQHA